MILKTYGVRPERADKHGLEHLDSSCHVSAIDPGTELPGALVKRCDCQLKPGDRVKAVNFGGVGLVVAINDEEVCVLWSVEPRDRFSHIAFPVVRRVSVPLIANRIVSIQPMSQPSGLIFYMDYTYGEMDKRCTEGPLWSRLYWRGRRALRCWKQKTQSCWWSFRSWLSSRSGQRSTYTVTQDDIIKAYIERKKNEQEGSGRPRLFGR